MMTPKDRAKQFQPFDAMKGLQEALRDREERHLRAQKISVAEDVERENDAVLCRIKKGMTVAVYCYSGFHHVTKTGIVSLISPTYRYLTINGERIFFDDIYSLAILDN